jgi:anti-anti-sigma regulatory factor
MLKIAADPIRRTLALEGRVAGPWVEELRRVCDSAVTHDGLGPALTLDLAAVAFVDRAGLDLLRELASRGYRFRNGSPFINEQLKEVFNGVL